MSTHSICFHGYKKNICFSFEKKNALSGIIQPISVAAAQTGKLFICTNICA